MKTLERPAGGTETALSSARSDAKPAAALTGGAVLAGGILLMFYPTLLSGFARVQVDALDSRLINHILEHGWLWLRGDPAHAELWSPPVFWPAGNTAAYSETLLGVAPFYWVWRALGVTPETAYQVWLIELAVLNYATAVVVLRRGLLIGAGGSIAGAALISFGSPRIQQLIHAQLLPVFYALAAVYAVRRMLDRPHQAGRYVVMLGAAIVGQLYASFYLGWFVILGLGVAALLAIPSRHGRASLAGLVKRQWTVLVGTVVVAIVVLVPMLRHYLEAARTRGYREFSEVLPMLPRPQSWVYMGPSNWIYGDLFDAPVFNGLPMEHEHRLGVGFVTALAAVAGLALRRRDRIAWYLGGSVVGVCALAMLWPWEVTAWRLVFDTVPGAAAVRAASRAGLFLLLPLGIGLAWTVDGLVSRRRGRWAALLVGFCLLEQGATLPSFDKAVGRADVAALAARVPAASAAFLYLPADQDFWRGQVDAMWASAAIGKPTLNGYSGNIPPGWPFARPIVAAGGEVLRQALRDWSARHGFDPDDVAIIDDR